MEPARCPCCGEATVVVGSFYPILNQNQSVSSTNFVPEGLSAFRVTVGIPFSESVHACASCGRVWSSIDPHALRELIRKNGSELAKQQLDEFDQGPYRGLPDTSLAREIGGKVAEIDALVRSGKIGAAGRYREIKGATWDQAIKDTKNWRDLSRDEKLALFGWEPKKKGPVDDLDSPYY